MSFFVNRSHKRIQQGDLVEFEKVFQRLYAPLCSFARQFVNDMDSAEEIVQDFFYTYWKKKQDISVVGSMDAYMYRAVKNRALKQIEHQKVRQKYAANMQSLQAELSEPESSSLETAELEGIINRTLGELPERCRQIFVLSRYEGLKYQEIAKKLAISVKTVEANMGKALQMFRANLKKYDSLPN